MPKVIIIAIHQISVKISYTDVQIFRQLKLYPDIGKYLTTIDIRKLYCILPKIMTFFLFLYIGTVALCILNKIYLTNSSSKTALILFFRDKNKSHMKITLFGFHLLETAQVVNRLQRK